MTDTNTDSETNIDRILFVVGIVFLLLGVAGMAAGESLIESGEAAEPEYTYTVSMEQVEDNTDQSEQSARTIENFSGPTQTLLDEAVREGFIRSSGSTSVTLSNQVEETGIMLVNVEGVSLLVDISEPTVSTGGNQSVGTSMVIYGAIFVVLGVASLAIMLLEKLSIKGVGAYEQRQ
jgi:hypothetical protein